MESYKGWPIYETMPEGYRIDKTAGSPLHGYEFITNGKSIINGGKRALVRFQKEDLRLVTPSAENAKAVEPQENESKPAQVIDGDYARTVNELARKKFEQRLLADIRVDLMVCEIEGWNKIEYIEELKTLINGIGNRTNNTA